MCRYRSLSLIDIILSVKMTYSWRMVHNLSASLKCFVLCVQLLRAPVHRQDYREAVDVLASVENGLDSGCRQREKGLSLLVQYVLGKPLDKTEQLSNWERRPLRLKQIIYAGE